MSFRVETISAINLDLVSYRKSFYFLSFRIILIIKVIKMKKLQKMEKWKS